MWKELTTLDPPQTYRLPLAAAALSALLLGGAHAFERFGNMSPCALCLTQREVHWAILGLSALALIAFWRTPVRSVRLLFYGALAAAFLTSAGVAGYHAGVEYDWWEGPASCSGGGVAPSPDGENLLDSLRAPTNAVPCDKAAWSFAGISMAGYNFLISLAGAAAILAFAYKGRDVLGGEHQNPIEA